MAKNYLKKDNYLQNISEKQLSNAFERYSDLHIFTEGQVPKVLRTKRKAFIYNSPVKNSRRVSKDKSADII